MPYFQAPNGALHYLTEEDIANGCESYLPLGCAPITDAAAIAIQEQPVPPQVPEEVSMMQARLSLLQAGLLDQVDAQIAAMTEPPRIASKIRWEFATAVRRDDPLVTELGAALGLSQAQLDQLFITAATL